MKNLNNIENIWETNDSEEDFFSFNESGQNTIIEEEIETTETIDDEVDEEDFFAETSENENIENIENTVDEKSKSSKITSVDTLKYLKEKGFIDYELEDNQELTEDFANEVVDSGFEKIVETKVENLLKELPDTLSYINKFVLNGGNLNEVLSELYKNQNSVSIPEEVDFEVENTHENVLRQLLLLDGEDPTVVEAQIKFYKDSGNLETISENKYNKYIVSEKERKENELKVLRDKKENDKKLINQNIKETQDFITQNKNIGFITFDNNDSTILPEYLNKPTVKLSNGTIITEMQKDLFYELPKNKQAMMQLAFLLKHRNTDGTFNFDNIAKNFKNKPIKDLENNLRRNSTDVHSSAGGGNTKVITRSLADYFN